MPKRISSEAEAKIMEAYRIMLTVDEAAAYAGIATYTVSKYWKAAGLEPTPNSKKYIDDFCLDKILEAHNLKMSIKEAAKYSKATISMVKYWWRKAGLESQFEQEYHSMLSKEKREKILKAHELGMSINKTTEYAKVGYKTIIQCWKEAGFKSKYKKWIKKVTIWRLLDNVFDTKNNPDEEITVKEIERRLNPKRGCVLDKKSLEKNLAEVVRLGFYETVLKDGETYYKPGMPSAMDGMVN